MKGTGDGQAARKILVCTRKIQIIAADLRSIRVELKIHTLNGIGYCRTGCSVMFVGRTNPGVTKITNLPCRE
ncbi:hypothetical protein ASE96_16540 [Arthrobacter sp. Leaf69]|nr:hypothetical protein ASE96_16540 [Arthrobacter sp. Leaf69]